MRMRYSWDGKIVSFINALLESSRSFKLVRFGGEKRRMGLWSESRFGTRP